MTQAAGKAVAIVQSCYVPWKGYFDLINSVDEFVLYDDQQYTKRDWRNRNRVKTAQGTIWLSIPVKVRGRYHQRIDETEISDPAWARRHWRTIAHAYRTAPYFDAYRERLEALYEAAAGDRLLSEVNRRFLEGFCRLLGIHTALTWSTDYRAEGRRTDRLVNLCLEAGAATYVSGPSARSYLDESRFHDAGIEIRYFDYAGYPAYEQLYPPFEHAVSIVDLLVHTGPGAPSFLKSFGVEAGGRDAA